MMPSQYEHLTIEFEPEGDPEIPFRAAQELETKNLLEEAATLYNRAFGLDPDNQEIRTAFSNLLDRMAIKFREFHFRYIPGGVFLMGDHFSERDEAPWHPVWLKPYWLMETCVSWDQLYTTLNWEQRFSGRNQEYPDRPEYAFIRDDPYVFHFIERLADLYSSGTSDNIDTLRYSHRNREDISYSLKPFTAVPYQLAHLLTVHLNDHQSPKRYRLSIPTEAQWEKAARGGLIGEKYPWGSAPPSPDLIDCDRFYDFGIKPMKSLPPNAYGLYGMCGGVWEWTHDFYDREYYRESPHEDPIGPITGEERVIRGGSWADCPEVCTVSYRNSMSDRTIFQRVRGASHHLTPTIGFRLALTRLMKF